jgi:hypothetical protein
MAGMSGGALSRLKTTNAVLNLDARLEVLNRGRGRGRVGCEKGIAE